MPSSVATAAKRMPCRSGRLAKWEAYSRYAAASGVRMRLKASMCSEGSICSARHDSVDAIASRANGQSDHWRPAAGAAVAALRLEAVPCALAALAAGQTDLAAALRDTAAAGLAEARPDVLGEFEAWPLHMAPAAHAAALRKWYCVGSLWD